MKKSDRGVAERIFFLDCARKYYTPEWVKRLMRTVRENGFNVFYVHFSEDIGLRLESKQYPWLAGGDHSLCVYGVENGIAEDDEKYYTQETMAELVHYGQSLGLEIVPSFDSPGHMNYAVKKYNEYFGSNISNYFHRDGRVELVHGSSKKNEAAQLNYSRGIDLSNEEGVTFAKNLYREYGEFFRTLGCTKFDIGGDELLGFGETIDETRSKWQNLDHWDAYAKEKTGNENAVAYDAFVLYINEICELLRGLGYTHLRMWNDDVYRDFDTGYTGVTQIDPTLEIQYWSKNANGGKNTVFTYLERGHKVLNFISYYTYYVVGMGSYFGVPADQVEREWDAYLFDKDVPENNPKAPCEGVLGGGYCLWSDMPATETEDEVLEHVLPFIKAIGKKLM